MSARLQAVRKWVCTEREKTPEITTVPVCMPFLITSSMLACSSTKPSKDVIPPFRFECRNTSPGVSYSLTPDGDLYTFL